MRSDTLLATLPDLSARIMRDALSSELQIDWETFCRHSHVKPVRLDEGTNELLAQEELLLQQGFVTSTSACPNLWYDVGVRYRAMKYGTFGLAMMTAETLGKALDIACKYQALTYSLINYRYVEQANGSCALIGDTSQLPVELRNFTQHRDLGAIRTLVYDLMGGEAPLERVSIAAPPPADWASVARSFPCPVEFDAARTEWRFRPGASRLALPLADQGLVTLYSTRCDLLLSRARSNAPVSLRLAGMLAAMAERFPSASEVADQLALSERTLHRRLADEGTRFSALVDEARYARAQRLLAERGMTIENIAFAVGFSEPSSFSRAFKRWSGVGALEYRRRMLDDSTPH